MTMSLVYERIHGQEHRSTSRNSTTYLIDNNTEVALNIPSLPPLLFMLLLLVLLVLPVLLLLLSLLALIRLSSALVIRAPYSINAAVRVAFLHLTEMMGWPAERVVIMGRSLGSGPAARLAREFRPGVGHNI